MQLSDSDAEALGTLSRRHFGDNGHLLESSARSSVRLSRTQPCPDTGTGSRFGGTALLPTGRAWPATDTGKPLSFLAQVSTADIPEPAGAFGLPGDTLLAFFYEADEQAGWGSDPGDRQFWTVIPVAAADAAAVAAPPGALTFPAYRMLARMVTTIPDYDELPLVGLDADYDDAFERLRADLDGDDKAPRHRMFGWPDLVQNSMQLELGAADWLLLLQLDTDDAIGWMWGDVGTIYYWIRHQDLLAGRFDQTWMIFQCY